MLGIVGIVGISSSLDPGMRGIAGMGCMGCTGWNGEGDSCSSLFCILSSGGGSVVTTSSARLNGGFWWFNNGVWIAWNMSGGKLAAGVMILLTLMQGLHMLTVPSWFSAPTDNLWMKNGVGGWRHWLWITILCKSLVRKHVCKHGCAVAKDFLDELKKKIESCIWCVSHSMTHAGEAWS